MKAPAIVVAFFWPVLALAEPLVIRSGEHEAFSRLVITLPEGASWSIDASDAGETLVVSDHADGFDTTEVFDRIPRARLIDLRQPAPDRLEFVYSCECYLDAFLWRADRLVVDLVSGQNPEVLADVDEPPQTIQNETVLPNLLALRRAEQPVLGAPNEAPGITFSDTDQEVREIEAALLEGIARAATQGILDPALTQETTPPEPEPVSDPVSPQPMAEEQAFPDNMPVPSQPGIGITTAFDRDLARLSDELSLAIGRECLASELFDIDQWLGDSAFNDQLARLVEGLVVDFGQEADTAKARLARFYIAHGFGAEARLLLQESSAQSQDRQIAMELANLVDDRDHPMPLIQSQRSCETTAMLWAFIADPWTPSSDHRDHLLKSFFLLPQPLRGQLAPRMSGSFLEIGDSDAAEKVLNATENNDTSSLHDTAVARADIANETQGLMEAIDVLSDEANDNPRATPNSIARLIELKVSNGQQPTDEDLLLASALRQEYRADPVANQLAVAEALGRASRGEYVQALELLRIAEGASADGAYNVVYEQLAGNATDVDFLEISYSSLPDVLTAETENSLAQRMLSLGFPERALEILSTEASREAAAERRYLKAEANIALRDARTALAVISGLSDDRARMLQSQAYSILGEHDQALSALRSDDTSRDQTDLRFRAGAWDGLALSTDSTLSDFAATQLNGSAVGEATTLSEGRALLDQSQTSRAAVEALLSRFSTEDR